MKEARGTIDGKTMEFAWSAPAWDGAPQRAAAEMRRYLRLAPDAANARQGQDKIYEWEDPK